MEQIVDFFNGYGIDNLALDCWSSFIRVIAGVSLAIIIGIPLGLLRSMLPSRLKHNNLFKFILEAPKFPPPIAWIPLVVIIFGISELSAYIIVFIGAVSPIFTNTYEGAESIPSVIKNTARSLEVKGLKYIIFIIFPSALPQIFTGIRVGVSMGWMSVIAAEMVSGQSGLGYAIQLNRLNLQYNGVLIDIFMIGLIGFILFEAVVFVEKRLIPWHVKSRGL